MENKAHAMAAGIFVVVCAVLLLGLAAWLTRDTGVRDIYEISTRETVTGLQSQAPVRFRGVDVGKVASISFDPKQQGNVLLRLEVDREVPMTRDTFATLSYQGVTGLAFIQLSDRGKQAARLQPNGDDPPRIPLEPGLVAKLQDKGEAILDQVQQVTERMNKLLNDDNQQRLNSAIARLDETLGSVDKLTKDLDKTVTQRVDPAVAEATGALRSARQAADEVGRTAGEFRATARRLNEKGGPVDQLAEGTQALSQAAETFNTATLPRINRVADEGAEAVRELGRTVTGIRENPQSLIYGNGAPRPGPGEPGFSPPGAGK
jgi:phospholipid/cholesterol/gamma-HCH transport system substrate-binding protein